MKRRKRAKNTEKYLNTYIKWKDKGSALYRAQMKNKFKMIAQRKHRERKGKRDTVSRGVCSKFFSFSYTRSALEGERKISAKNQNGRFGSKMYAFSPSPQLYTRVASLSKIPSILLLCLWLKLRQRNFLTDLELYPQGSPTRTMDPNVLRRNHKRACNDLARTDALLNSLRRSLSYFLEIS